MGFWGNISLGVIVDLRIVEECVVTIAPKIFLQRVMLKYDVTGYHARYRKSKSKVWVCHVGFGMFFQMVMMFLLQVKGIQAKNKEEWCQQDQFSNPPACII